MPYERYGRRIDRDRDSGSLEDRFNWEMNTSLLSMNKRKRPLPNRQDERVDGASSQAISSAFCHKGFPGDAQRDHGDSDIAHA